MNILKKKKILNPFTLETVAVVHNKERGKWTNSLFIGMDGRADCETFPIYIVMDEHNNH